MGCHFYVTLLFSGIEILICNYVKPADGITCIIYSEKQISLVYFHQKSTLMPTYSFIKQINTISLYFYRNKKIGLNFKIFY